jgi:hypothetical protein
MKIGWGNEYNSSLYSECFSLLLHQRRAAKIQTYLITPIIHAPLILYVPPNVFYHRHTIWNKFSRNPKLSRSIYTYSSFVWATIQSSRLRLEYSLATYLFQKCIRSKVRFYFIILFPSSTIQKHENSNSLPGKEHRNLYQWHHLLNCFYLYFLHFSTFLTLLIIYMTAIVFGTIGPLVICLYKLISKDPLELILVEKLVYCYQSFGLSSLLLLIEMFKARFI